MSFPDTADLGTLVELNLGSVWTDITSSTRTANLITITRGRADYASAIDPSTVALQLRNTDGSFSQYNPTGPYYGLLTRNTPLRVSIAAGSPFLNHPSSGTDRRLSTPSAAPLQITGDLDARWDIESSNWDSGDCLELGGQWGASGQRGWHAYVFAGTLRMAWTTDGITEVTAAASLSTAVHPRRMCVRATIDVNNGAGGRSIAFYTGPTLSGPWSQIGTTAIVAGTSATATSTAAVEIGDVTTTAYSHVQGRIYAAQIRSGIGGTIVASPDLSTLQPGATTFTDGTGVAWTANASDAITNRIVRGTVEVPSWPSRWGTSGQLVTVDLEASGILRRLRKGTTPLDSALRRSIVAAAPTAYWPLEDGSESTQGASGLLGGIPMKDRGVRPQFAAITGPSGSLPLPDFTNGGALTVSRPLGSASGWTIEAVMLFPSVFATTGVNAPLGWITDGTAFSWVLAAQPGTSGGFTFTWSNATATSPHGAPLGNLADGQWHQVRITVYQSGSDIKLQLWVDGTMLFEDTDTGVTCGAIRTVSINPSRAIDPSLPSVGHVAVWSPKTTVATWPAVFGYDGETADVRMTRLAGEESVPLLRPFGLCGDTLVGPQRPNTPLALLQESADADVGILYEQLDSISLAARPRTSLYNQTPMLVLDYAQQQVAPPLEPADDDQQTRNDITRSRPNGSSARVTLDSGPMSTAAPPAGVGRYQDSGDVNVHSDSQLPQIAGWALHLGTVDGVRYPTVTINLHKCPELIDAARAVDIGDRIQILNLPLWLPPDNADLIVQGVSETLGVRTWTITFTCTPGAPWNVAVLDDDELGRADTDGSSLAAAVAAGDTHLLVQVTAGRPWTADLAQLPLDLRIGGEVVTVTDILSGPAGDRFDRTVASSWGTATSGQAWTTTGGSSSDYSVTGG